MGLQFSGVLGVNQNQYYKQCKCKRTINNAKYNKNKKSLLNSQIMESLCYNKAFHEYDVSFIYVLELKDYSYERVYRAPEIRNRNLLYAR